MITKAGVWVSSHLWGAKFQYSFQAFDSCLKLWMVKVMNLGFVKSNGKLSITLKFDAFIMLV